VFKNLWSTVVVYVFHLTLKELNKLPTTCTCFLWFQGKTSLTSLRGHAQFIFLIESYSECCDVWSEMLCIPYLIYRLQGLGTVTSGDDFLWASGPSVSRVNYCHITTCAQYARRLLKRSLHLKCLWQCDSEFDRKLISNSKSLIVNLQSC
jgi:hypothetical protein